MVTIMKAHTHISTSSVECLTPGEHVYAAQVHATQDRIIHLGTSRGILSNDM